MKYLNKWLIVVLMVFGTLSTLQAQKTGYVNSDAILLAMPETKAADTQLAEYKKTLDAEIQAKIDVYQQNLVVAQQRIEKELLTPIQKGEIQKAIKDEEDTIVAFEQEQSNKYSERTVELLNPIIDKINTAISEVAKENGYQMILDTKTNLVIYSDGTGDITELVARKLGLPVNQN